MELDESIQVVLAAILGAAFSVWLGGVRRVPHDRIGLVERRIWLARRGEIAWQPRVLEGGLHVGLFPWRYRLHRVPLVRVAEGRIAYVYARNGASLAADQTLGRAVAADGYRDAEAFLSAGGQRGRQREILREGLHAVHLVQFVVITEDTVHVGPVRDPDESRYEGWRRELMGIDGFGPVVIGAEIVDEEKGEQAPPLPEEPSGRIGIVTVHDGPPEGANTLPVGKGREERIDLADPDAFLAGGGGRGRQHATLGDGVYYLNRWFATVEIVVRGRIVRRRRTA